MYLQINKVKYNADRENYKYLWEYTNSLIPVFHWYVTNHLYLVYFKYLLVLSVFRFVANEYQRRAIQLLLTIHNIRSTIRWAIPKVILNFSCLHTTLCLLFWSLLFTLKMFYSIGTCPNSCEMIFGITRLGATTFSVKTLSITINKTWHSA